MLPSRALSPIIRLKIKPSIFGTLHSQLISRISKFSLSSSSSECLLRDHQKTTYDHHSGQQQKGPTTLISHPVYTNTFQCRHNLCTAAESKDNEESHSIISDSEHSSGQTQTLQFQAETRQLLDIVARSLYSEKEVFIREVISNSSDALEKLRYRNLSGEEAADLSLPLEIHIATDEKKKTFTIQDTGVGMTREELIDNLGCIARSGSKAFLEQLSKSGGTSNIGNNLIGQFGVGFYSTFMVGNHVEVYTKSSDPESPAYKWSSDGTGQYDISEAEGVQRGTKVIVHLKNDCSNFCNEDKVKEIVTRYSNFVGTPIYLNGKLVNTIQAVWLMEPHEVTNDMHSEFYRFVAGASDEPRYHLHYKTDAPINIRALLYIPEYKPTFFDFSRENDVGVTLYSRKVMVMSHANNILPRWLHFFRGVVDSEDIPLNLSRELLQDSALIRKLRDVLTRRIVKFLVDQAKKDEENYQRFFDDYGVFIREGILTTSESDLREDIAKLLRFESSHKDPGVRISFEDYISRMKAGARDIYYLSSSSRQLAETSPYYETFLSHDTEVLFLYEPYDEFVLLNMGQFDRKNLKSIENVSQDVQTKDSKAKTTEATEDMSSSGDVDQLMSWMKVFLSGKVKDVKVTKRLDKHPCIVTVPNMGAVRHILRTSVGLRTPEEKFEISQPTLEVNPDHKIIKKLCKLRNDDPDLAKLVTEQILENAMLHAGLLNDPRSALSSLNDLLIKTLDKH